MTAKEIHGPYLHKNGRKYVRVLVNGKRISKNYARYLLELRLERELTSDETVDHIDEDKTNDNIGNLQILTNRQNALKSCPTEFFIFYCLECKELAIKRMAIIRQNQIVKGSRGPFCGHRCAAIDRRRVRRNGV